jgi:hypothetical protein
MLPAGHRTGVQSKGEDYRLRFCFATFTSAVKVLQERYGGGRQFARQEKSGNSPNGKPTGLGLAEQEYLSGRHNSTWQASAQAGGLTCSIAAIRRGFLK